MEGRFGMPGPAMLLCGALSLGLTFGIPALLHHLSICWH